MSSDGRNGAGLGGVPGFDDGFAPPTGVRVVRGARLLEDSSFRVDRLVRFSLRASLALLILAADVGGVAIEEFTMFGSTPLDVVELSRSNSVVSAVVDVDVLMCCDL